MKYTFILANDSSLDASYVTMESFTGMHGHKDPVPILTHHSTKVTMSHAGSLLSRKLDCSFPVG